MSSNGQLNWYRAVEQLYLLNSPFGIAGLPFPPVCSYLAMPRMSREDRYNYFLVPGNAYNSLNPHAQIQTFNDYPFTTPQAVIPLMFSTIPMFIQAFLAYNRPSQIHSPNSGTCILYVSPPLCWAMDPQAYGHTDGSRDGVCTSPNISEKKLPVPVWCHRRLSLSRAQTTIFTKNTKSAVGTCALLCGLVGLNWSFGIRRGILLPWVRKVGLLVYDNNARFTLFFPCLLMVISATVTGYYGRYWS